MKFRMISGLLLIYSGVVGASEQGFDLKMNLSLKGEHISSPRVVVKDGEMATVVQNSGSEKTFMEVVATENRVNGKNAISMKFSIGKIDVDGIKRIISEPQIIALENEKAEMILDDKDGRQDISLSVTATRKELH
jgi:hypothetical protein